MRVTWISHLLLLVCFSCNSQNNDGRLLSEGVLLPPNGGIFWEDTVSVLNQDGSEYAKIWANENGITKVNYPDSSQMKNIILKSFENYYPDRFRDYKKYNNTPPIAIRSFDNGYDSPLMVFDAKKLGEKYQVFVNGEWKGIKYPEPLVYKKWSEFILTVSVGITPVSPLRTTKGNSSEIIDDYEKYSYKVIKLDGDWLQVQCWSDCEGCPEGKIIQGWVKWKDGDRLLIELYYIC